MFTCVHTHTHIHTQMHTYTYRNHLLRQTINSNESFRDTHLGIKKGPLRSKQFIL